MPTSFQQFALSALSGKNRSWAATLLRGLLRIAEPFYATVMRLRNRAYDRGFFKTYDLGRPTISIGNITTGGTGKTPVVQWLANELRSRGYRPAILLRGYGSSPAQFSDEAQLLVQTLNDPSQLPIPVQPNPSRIRGAADVLRDFPETTHLILDDGFQHRKAARDFNLVLISATQPFGFDHVLPRGLLREPLSGLSRADAFLITRSSLVADAELKKIDHFLRVHYPVIPVFHCDHQQVAVRNARSNERKPIETVANLNVFLTAGIGDPAAFERQITARGCHVIGTHWLADHHPFTDQDLKAIFTAAKAAGAQLILTTEKDWVKIKSHVPADQPVEVGVIELQIQFKINDGAALFDLMNKRKFQPQMNTDQ